MRVFISILLFLFFSTCYSQKQKSESVHFQSKKFPGEDLRYLVYKPKGFKPGGLYPVLFFLHGVGSQGPDLEILKKEGLPKLMEEGLDLPFLVIAPQRPAINSNYWPPRFVDEIVVHALTHYPADPNRLCMSGFSMGATGVWDYSCAFPAKVSSAVPLSGWGDVEAMCKMKGVPTWAFHGLNDQIINIVGSRNVTYALRNCGGDVTLTELPGTGHESWRTAYTYPGLNNWILSKNRADTIRRKGVVKVNTETIAYKLPRPLFQITGIDCLQNDELFGITDKTGNAVLLNFDTMGHIKRMVRVKNASNLSWQDLTHNTDYVYIADVGNSNFKRKYFQIYKVRKKDLLEEEAVNAEIIEFTVDVSLPLDFKSIFFLNNSLYLFGESSAHKFFLIQVADRPEIASPAMTVKGFRDLKMTSITSSYFDDNTRSLYLLDKNQIGVISMQNGIESLPDRLSSVINLPTESLKEGITRLPEGNLIYVDQNFLGTSDGNLYIIQGNHP
jgi:predicted esterase